MNTTKTYSYTKEIKFDFEAIANDAGLPKEKPCIADCIEIIDDYIAGLDNCDYYVIDNQTKIAEDFYKYLKNRNKKEPMKQDIYTITPQIEAQLTHAIARLDDYFDDCRYLGNDVDERVEEVYKILQNLPFFKKNY